MTPPTSGGPILPPSAAPLREVIGDFEVEAKLGAGGMGAVYRARQISLGRMVALKVLPAHMIEDAESVSRFQREARVAASLSHANLVRVFSAGAADGIHYIAMELIEGEDLGRRLKREVRLPAPEALRICAEVARGLEHAWRTAHLIHRDIKPANIFLAGGGAVKVGDLGLAKSVLGNTTGLTQSGTMLGTPHYISPEQARADKEIDFRAVIYSLGCTLYQMLTGQVPYAGSDPITIIRQHLDAPLPAILKVWPQCPVPLARLVGKMLKKSRHERHASYAELIAQIESVWAQLDPLSFNPEVFAPPTKPDPDATLLDTPPTPRATATLAPSAPPPKSKAPLYAGIAAGVFALAGAAFVFWPKEEKLTKAELYAKQQEAERAAAKPELGETRSSATPTSAGDQGGAGARPSVAPAAEPWEALLDTPDRLQFTSGAGLNAGKLSVPGGGQAGVKNSTSADGALRVRGDFRHKTQMLRARSTPYQHYVLAIVAPDQARLWRATGQDEETLKEVTLPRSIAPGEECELELRITGSRLSAFVNRQPLGDVQDDRLRTGSFNVANRGNSPLSITQFDFLDLGKSTGASATPAAKPWQDALRDPGVLEQPNQAEKTADGLRLPDKATLTVKASPRDGALRIRATFSSTNGLLLRARYQSGVSAYALKVRRRVEIQREGDGKLLPLADYPLPQPIAEGAEYEAELRVVGAEITVRVNGTEVGKFTDPNPFTAGVFAVSNYTGAPAVLKALDFLRLAPGAAPPDASNPAAATKDAPFVNSLGMKFVPVPITGGPTGGQRVLFSIWETRVQDYEAFCQASGRKRTIYDVDPPQSPTHPVMRVSWTDAGEFCQWLTVREREAGRLATDQLYRLPSDHEWSCAAGIGEREEPSQSPEKKHHVIAGIYPWGTQWPLPAAVENLSGEEGAERAAARKQKVIAGYRDAFEFTSPVGSFAPNVFGLYDLGGNLAEWCGDWSEVDRSRRVSRGGSWFATSSEGAARSSYRHFDPFSEGKGYIGFRIVLAPVP